MHEAGTHLSLYTTLVQRHYQVHTGGWRWERESGWFLVAGEVFPRPACPHQPASWEHGRAVGILPLCIPCVTYVCTCVHLWVPPLCIPCATYVCTCVHLTKVEFLLLCILRVTVWIKQKWDHPWVHTMCLCACGTIWNYSGDPPCVSAHIMCVLVSTYIWIILLHSIPTYMVTTWCRFGSPNMEVLEFPQINYQ